MPSRSARGFTLVEILIAMGSSLVVAVLVVTAFIQLQSQQVVRKNVAELQTSARQALELLEADLRHASLGASTGVVWQASGGNRVARAAVQVLTTLPGATSAVIANAKAGTDAVLVVEAVPAVVGGRTVTVGALTTSIGAFNVVDASRFGAGENVLIGEYGDGAWGMLEVVTSSAGVQQLTLRDTATNVLPGRPVPHLGTGAPVRRARTRLYYVDTADQLVRLTLTQPRPPAAATEIAGREVLATGVENMQVDCELSDGGTVLTACSDVSGPAPVLASGDPITVEAEAAFGTFAAGAGPRISIANVNRLRQVVVSVALRSGNPIVDVTGDSPIGLLGASGATSVLGPSAATGVSTTAAFARRSYRIAAGLRNTSLETL
jgi:Tfp pilus assembly protein PilV